MDAIARIYVDAGDADQIQNGLSNSEKKEMLTVIGKQVSDYEDTIISKVAPQFGQNKLSTGDYDLDELKMVVAHNIKQIDKHKFRYCARIREYVEHTYTIVHRRSLPDHMLPDHQGDKKRNKTDQLNFEADAQKRERESPNPNHKNNNKGGPFGNGYGRGRRQDNSNRWNNYPARGKNSKGDKGKDKGKDKGRGKGPKGKNGKGKGKSGSSKGKHADKECHHCGKKGHIKAQCFKYLALQGNERYQKAKQKHSPRVQLCMEILEDAVGMDKCKHCFQHDCTPQTCFFPPKQHEAMTKAKSLFFDSDMYDTCFQNKCNSWHTPHTNDDWYGTNNQPPEEASGWWHDYKGNDREAWTIEAEWYTDEWFNKEERNFQSKQ